VLWEVLECRSRTILRKSREILAILLGYADHSALCPAVCSSRRHWSDIDTPLKLPPLIPDTGEVQKLVLIPIRVPRLIIPIADASTGDARGK
jgi:hypothetical protein